VKPLTHAAHRKFVEREGWTKQGTARGSGRTGDHYRYSLALATGEVLITRVSDGAGQINDPKLIAAILRVQLAVSEQDFWACVDGGVLPPRPQPQAPSPPGEVLDANLVRNLIRKVGLSENDIAALTKVEAARQWEEYRSEGGS
jgi:hypothetical protein